MFLDEENSLIWGWTTLSWLKEKKSSKSSKYYIRPSNKNSSTENQVVPNDNKFSEQDTTPIVMDI